MGSYYLGKKAAFKYTYIQLIWPVCFTYFSSSLVSDCVRSLGTKPLSEHWLPKTRFSLLGVQLESDSG